MIIHNCDQRTPEWHAARATCVITASDMGAFCVPDVIVTADQLKKDLKEQGIEIPAKALKDDLMALVPNIRRYWAFTDTQMKARMNHIAKRLAEPFYAPETADAWLLDLRAKEDRQMEYNIPVQRGIAMEPLAREQYTKRTGHKGIEVGFVSHDSEGFGASPDWLIPSSECEWSHGLELKCPIPETHIKWLLAGGLPDEHKHQVHGSMAVTGLPFWDFMSFCPGLPDLLIRVHRDSYTEQLLHGLESLHAEFVTQKARISAMWNEAFAQQSAA